MVNSDRRASRKPANAVWKEEHELKSLGPLDSNLLLYGPSSCVTLGMVLNLSEPHFPYLYKIESDTYLLGLKNYWEIRTYRCA